MSDSIHNVLASPCPECAAENVAYAAFSFHRNGLNLPYPEQITSRECGHVFQTNWLALRRKTAEEINSTYGGIKCLVER
jgi:hypothetical protein